MTELYTDEMHDRVDETLAHYGVLGMKWGRRKADTRGSTPPSSRNAIKAVKDKVVSKLRKKSSGENDSEGESSQESPKKHVIVPSETAVVKNRRVNVGDLSDAQLIHALNRMRLEEAFEKAVSEPPKRKSEGRKIAEDVLKSTARTQGKKLANYAVTQALDKVFPGYAKSSKKGGGGKKSKDDGVDIESALKGAVKTAKEKASAAREEYRSRQSEKPKKDASSKSKKPKKTKPSRSGTSGVRQTYPSHRRDETRKSEMPPEVIDILDQSIELYRRR